MRAARHAEIQLGDLVAAVYDAVARFGSDPKVGAHLAAQMIMVLLHESASGGDANIPLATSKAES